MASVSKEETRGDLERVKVILQKLQTNNLDTNSRLSDIQIRYTKICSTAISKGKNLTAQVYEDNITSDLIKENDLKEFLPSNMKPARVKPNGNCLFNAASLYLLNDNSLSLAFRLLTSIELFLNCQFYVAAFRLIWENDDSEFRNELSFFKSLLHHSTTDQCTKSEEISSMFRREAIVNCTDRTIGYNWSSLPCLAALSSVLGYEINSVYSQRKNLKLFPIFTRKFRPREVSNVSTPAITLVWTNTSLDNDSNMPLQPNHFSVMVPLTVIKPVDFGNTQDKLEKWRINDASGSSASTITTTTTGKQELSFALPNTSYHRMTKQTKLTFVTRKRKYDPDGKDLSNLENDNDDLGELNEISTSAQVLIQNYPSSNNTIEIPTISTAELFTPSNKPSTLTCSVSITEPVATSSSSSVMTTSSSIVPTPTTSTINIAKSKIDLDLSIDIAKNSVKLKTQFQKEDNRCSKNIKRGEPVISANKCDPNDIGLFYKTAHSLPDSDKYERLKNVWKPPPTHKFPKHSDNGRNWKFQRKYVDESSRDFYPWLAYSMYLDGAFCVPCVFFGNRYEAHGLTKLYTEPFTRWNGANTRWKKHHKTEPMSMHQASVLACQTFISQMEGKQKKVEDIHNAVIQARIAENRSKIMPILKTIALCGKQNIPLRGHRDSSKHFDDSTINCGNFQALLDFRIEAGDQVLENHFETAPKNATYRSPTIQNEMITSCKKYIEEALITEIKGKFFSIIGDEASDASNTEQLSLVIRFIDDLGEIREEFTGYLNCENLKGEELGKMIIAEITRLGLDMNLCRGQCYDGAGNMAGAKSGCSTYILNRYPLALYFHCSSHRLNLAVADGCKIRTVRNMMDTIKKCSDVFRHSPKKNLVFKKTSEEELPGEIHRKLFDVCRTRWILRIDGMERFQVMLKPILCTLEKISNNFDGSYKSEARSDANGLLHRISTLDFMINLIVVCHVLSYVRPLTTELQAVKIDIGGVYEAVDTDLQALKNCRDDIDVKFGQWYSQAESLCKEFAIPITMPRVVQTSMYRTNHPGKTPQDYYRQSLCLPFIDTVINEFEGRFSKDHRIHGDAFYAIPSKVLSNVPWKSNLLNFAKSYEQSLPNPIGLPVELDLWAAYWLRQRDVGHTVPDSVKDTLIHLNPTRKTWFPNIYNILTLVGCVPGTSNSCERSISKLKLLKSPLRSTMGQDRLNGLALLSVHREISIDYKKVLNIFAADYPHRLRLINILDDESL